jgi:hypothetical protein
MPDNNPNEETFDNYHLNPEDLEMNETYIREQNWDRWEEDHIVRWDATINGDPDYIITAPTREEALKIALEPLPPSQK